MNCRRMTCSLAAAGLLALLACAADQPVPEKAGPVGSWEIKGTDSEGAVWTGKMVLKREKKGGLVGRIDWSGQGGDTEGASGREIVSGSYDPDTRTLMLKGQRLERANGINLGSYSAELSEDGSRLEKGQWTDDDSTWSARRSDEVKEAGSDDEETGFVEKGNASLFPLKQEMRLPFRRVGAAKRSVTLRAPIYPAA